MIDLPTDNTLDVVLIEDDPGDAFLVQELLSEADAGISTIWYRSMVDAIPHLGDSTACVLLDLHLPDASGLEGLHQVIQLVPHASVVVLTGLADRENGLRAVAAGAQDYLVKGEVDGALLARSIRYALERRRADDAARAVYEAELRAQENRRLERGLLPRPVLRDEAIECVVRYRPGGRRMLLGGDFYDAVETTDGQLCLMIGDVCGHGPDEAALGATLRTAWRTSVLAGLSAPQVLDVTEQILAAERGRPEIFATAVMVVINPERTALDLYLCGHPTPFLLGRPTTTLPSDMRGRALGIPVLGGWQPQHVPLGERWRVVLYTDGVLETTVDGGTDRLGEEGLQRVMEEQAAAEEAAGRGPGAPTIVERVLEAVRLRHGGDLVDDTAIVVLGWGGA